MVGQQRAVRDRAATPTPAAAATQSSPFQTIERKDVGTTLQAYKPQIGENGTVRMTIYQESSSLIAEGRDRHRRTPARRQTSDRSNPAIVVDDGRDHRPRRPDRATPTTSSALEECRCWATFRYLGALFRSEKPCAQDPNEPDGVPAACRDARRRDPASNRISLDRYDYIRAQFQIDQPAAAEQDPRADQRPSPVLPADSAPGSTKVGR